MKKILSPVLLCAALMSGVGKTHAESLYDAVQAAVNSHPSVQAAGEARNASEQNVREQRSSYFPELSATAQGGRVYGDNATSRGLSVTRGSGYSGLWEGQASLTQRLFDWGETGNKVDAARAREEAAVSAFAGARENAGLRAAQAYIALLRAETLKKAADANLSALEGYQEKIAIQVKEGGADEAELNRANDFLLLARNATIQFEGDHQQALADYIEATGAAPHSALKAPSLPTAFPATVDEAVSAAHAAHPQVLASRAAVVASDHDARVESTTYLPKISSQLSYLERDQKDVIGGEAKDARAVLKMDWNYSTGGAQHAREERAVFTRQQAKAQLDEIYRRVERDVRVAWSALEVSRRQKKTQADRRTATARVVETYKTQYEGGNRSLIEVMQAESQAFDASVAHDNADYGIMMATYTLLASMGQLVNTLEPDADMAKQSDDETARHDQQAEKP